MWTSPEDIRRRLGLSDDEAPDELVEDYIIDAQKELRRDIAFYVFDDVLSGNLDGTTFTLNHTFVADKNYDNTVDINDIEVYGWTDSDDPITRTTLSVSTIYPEYGKIVLTSVPSDYEKITACYYYYDIAIDTSLISEACTDLAAYYFAEREILLMPRQWMHGAYRYMKSAEYKDLIVSYERKKDRILGYASMKGEHDKAELIRGDI